MSGTAKPQLGDRLRLTAPMVNPNSKIIRVEDLPVGTEGTVDWIGSSMGQVCGVKWDNGSRLILMEGDQYEIL